MSENVSLHIVEGARVIKSADVPRGTTLSDALSLLGRPLELACGGRGLCGRCRVDVVAPNGERKSLLACSTRIFEETRVDAARLTIDEKKIADPCENAFERDSITTTSEEREGDLGLAVDLGTTTIVVALVSLASGRELDVRSRRNPQIRFGRDAISRVDAASRDPLARDEMKRDVWKTIETLAKECADRVGIPVDRTREIVVAGNTTMERLAIGLDVEPLGRAPFEVGERTFAPLSALALGLATAARVRFFPVFSAFIGGDVLSGFASLLARKSSIAQENALFLDVGTNGEAILSSRGKLFATSTAAGPAFEGAGISQGSFATPGAIRAIRSDLDPFDWRPETVGGIAASSVCGSGLVDALARALDLGVLAPSGRLRTKDDKELANAPERFRSRVFTRERERVFAIAEDEDPTRVLLTQRDVRQAQLALGAMKAGRLALLDDAGIDAADLDAIYLAGGFGASLNVGSSRRVGLTPSETPRERVVYCGNASLRGAVDALTGRLDLDGVASICDGARRVDLASRPKFAEEFADSMRF